MPIHRNPAEFRCSTAFPNEQCAGRVVHQPTSREALILCRIGCGALLVTMRAGRVSFSFEDGKPGGPSINQTDFNKFQRCGWLIPDSTAPALFEGLTAQRYLAGWP